MVAKGIVFADEMEKVSDIRGELTWLLAHPVVTAFLVEDFVDDPLGQLLGGFLGVFIAKPGRDLEHPLFVFHVLVTRKPRGFYTWCMAYMINGYDTSLPGIPSQVDFETIVKVTRGAWPYGVIEWDDGKVETLKTTVYRQWYETIFLYDTWDAYRSWTDHGLTVANQDSMIMVIPDCDALHFTSSAVDSRTGKLVEKIKNAIFKARYD